MNIECNSDNKYIKIYSAKNSVYTILSVLAFVILLALCVYIGYRFQDQYVKAMAIMFVPVALCVFLFKIVIFNCFGHERIEFGKQYLRIVYNYRYVYKDFVKEIHDPLSQIRLRTMESTDSMRFEELTNSKKKPYKLQFFFKNAAMYQSSKSIMTDDLKAVQQFLQSIYPKSKLL